MSSRLAIPWRVALQQSPPPFRQPESVCSTTEALATIRQRMVTCPFRNCLRLGVQSTEVSTSLIPKTSFANLSGKATCKDEGHTAGVNPYFETNGKGTQ